LRVLGGHPAIDAARDAVLDLYVGHLPRTTDGGGWAPTLDLLTPPEREVLLEVANGRSNVEIAAELVVSEATVKTHVGSIRTKLGLPNRVHAVIFAYDIGLIQSGPGGS
jgi:DNA-binding NarL/FixJ family response regulator